MYEPLREKNLFNAQRAELIRRFDLNKESWLAEEVIQRVEEALAASEDEDGISRLFPGQLLTDCRRKRVVLPLLSRQVAENLLHNGNFRSAKHQVIAEAQAAMARQIPGVEASEVKRIIAPRELIPHNGYGKYCPPKSPKYLSGKLAPPEKVGAKQRDWPAESDIWLSAKVVDSLVDYLTREEGISFKKAYAMIFRLAYLREMFCPRIDKLKAGQVAWIGISATERLKWDQRTAYRNMVPLVLTLHTKEELKQLAKVKNIDELDRIQQAQMARVLTEAYLQGGLLSLVDLQQLFLRSCQTFSRLMRRFMQEQGCILPTPGTVLDAGRAMTHKDIIINHYLDGYFSHEIARMTWHSPEAVDRYIDDFEKVMVLYFYGLPKRLISRVLNRGAGVVEEYMQLIEEHFPDKEDVKSHLRRCGVEFS